MKKNKFAMNAPISDNQSVPIMTIQAPASIPENSFIKAEDSIILDVKAAANDTSDDTK